MCRVPRMVVAAALVLVFIVSYAAPAMAENSYLFEEFGSSAGYHGCGTLIMDRNFGIQGIDDTALTDVHNAPCPGGNLVTYSWTRTYLEHYVLIEGNWLYCAGDDTGWRPTFTLADASCPNWMTAWNRAGVFHWAWLAGSLKSNWPVVWALLCGPV